ncbi:hypothetical protein [Kitasatospora sp. NPDC057223]|uniref:hypothetical protein n=1 Tax=Kitasatospora sp. NPDC057223 TaxID=3346055 RepID=UPI0036262493
MSRTALLLDATVVVSASAALVVAPGVLRRPVPPSAPARRRWFGGPAAALAAVVALIYLNQVLFGVYVLRVHGGDTSFVARYLPPGWFAVADGNAPVRWLAAHVPAPGLLAPTVLRVQAFLELPFVLLAFATVLRRLDGGRYLRVVRSPLLLLAAASYTVAFCVVEWDLHNPYTVDDILLRLLSAVAAPLLVRAVAARERAQERPVSVPGLLLSGVSLWAVGYLVLVVYDTALLYNLARLGDRLPGAAAALAVLAAAEYGAAVAERRAPAAGPAVATVADVLGRALVLFFVPALAIRYGASFGTPALAAAAAALVLLWSAAALTHGRVVTAAGLAGAAVAWAAVRLTADAYYEAALLRGATAFLLTVVGVCALADRHVRTAPEPLRKRADSPP